MIKTALSERPVLSMAILIGIVTLARLVLLFLYDTALGPDEAQYWFWGQSLDWGYYSKPPMIAWLIAGSTAIFGETVAGVRFFSPLLIGGTSMALFGATRALYGDQKALWVGTLWLFLPAIMLGATLITTDVPLLFFWSLALFFLVRLADAPKGRSLRYALALGAAIGFGFLSKYAMVYFVGAWGISLLLSDHARRTVRGIVPAGLVALAVFAPNLWWNFANGLQTLGHTADNANWGGQLLNPEELLDFLSSQFGVFGPFLFAAFLFGVVTIGTRLTPERRSRDLLLLPFALLPLIIICGQALLSRAHANWAMATYPAATILTVAWMQRSGARWVLWSSLGLHAIVGLIFTAVLLHLPLADRMGLSNSVKRLRGWEAQTEALAARAAGYDAVVTDEREVAAHLVWEWRDRDIEIRVADLNDRPDNTYEYAMPFAPVPEGRYLLVRPWMEGLCRYDAFGTVQEEAPSFVDLNATRRGRRERTFDVYTLEDYRPDAPDGC